MEKMKREYEEIGGKTEETVNLGEMWRKIDEIVAWINENEKRLHKPIPIKFYKRKGGLELLEQARGEDE